ncbi:MAG TPA: metal-dependent transcriptional regulator [Atribacteraceae bacterium]|nr:metal-dependent transcriptional regulator [Atribacteraceae bacterium]
MSLTESLEDYLQVIYQEETEKGMARVKDVANKLSVRASSVIDAVHRLKEAGYVSHEKGNFIRLTQPGLRQAEKSFERNHIVYKFLDQVLGVNPENAKKLTCGIEHHMNREFFDALSALCLFFERHPEIQEKYLRFRQSFEKGNVREMYPTLDQFTLGDRLKIMKIAGGNFVRQRLMAMGMTPGQEIGIERVAPLGDPIDVVLRGYHLSLRKEEAKCIQVEKQ